MEKFEKFKAPVYKGKSQEVQSFLRFLSAEKKLAINANERIKVNEFALKILKYIYESGIEFRLNQSYIQCFMMDMHIFDIVKITNSLFCIVVRNCHPTQLPSLDSLPTDGKPTVGKNSKTARVEFLLPTTNIGYRVFMENFMHFIYGVPTRYSRR
ncbi:MAG: hypothetical protein ACTSW7_00510 [Candidatus Thorarchaeota archaeon]|nr:hypothetical protein [Thermoplasmatales archaeon]